MGKILVKAPQAMMSPSGEIQFLYGGGQGKGGDRGSLPARALGGAGKFLGGLLGTTGPHQSLQSVLGGIQGGAVTGEAAGRWAGGFADRLPGGRTRAARRAIREQEAQDIAENKARYKERPREHLRDEDGQLRYEKNRAGDYKKNRAGDLIPVREGRVKRAISNQFGAPNWWGRKDKLVAIRSAEAAAKEAEEARRHIERLERAKAWREANASPTNPVDKLVQGTATELPASEATTRRAFRVIDQEVEPDPFAVLGSPREHNTSDSMEANLGRLNTQGSATMYGAAAEERKDMDMGHLDASSYNTTGPDRPDGPIDMNTMAQLLADLQYRNPQEVTRIEEMGKQQPAPIDAAMETFDPQ